MLRIANLHARFADQPILQGVNLAVEEGELHVLLGPNGSGKSTLGKVLLNHPHYEMTAGKVEFAGEDLEKLSTTERARLGIFLAHQSPPAVPGVPAEDLLRAAEKASTPEGRKPRNIVAFKKHLGASLERMRLPENFRTRPWNEGASGGERRKMEIVSLLTLGAKLAFLDEIDSGIDVDALRSIVEGIEQFLSGGNTSVILVTHQEKILQLLKPTRIHVFGKGKILHSGGAEVARKIHAEGFDSFLES